MSTSSSAAEYWLDRERFVVARLAVVTDPRTRRELERALVVVRRAAEKRAQVHSETGRESE